MAKVSFEVFLPFTTSEKQMDAILSEAGHSAAEHIVRIEKERSTNSERVPFTRRQFIDAVEGMLSAETIELLYEVDYRGALLLTFAELHAKGIDPEEYLQSKEIIPWLPDTQWDFPKQSAPK